MHRFKLCFAESSRFILSLFQIRPNGPTAASTPSVIAITSLSVCAHDAKVEKFQYLSQQQDTYTSPSHVYKAFNAPLANPIHNCDDKETKIEKIRRRVRIIREAHHCHKPVNTGALRRQRIPPALTNT